MNQTIRLSGIIIMMSLLITLFGAMAANAELPADPEDNGRSLTVVVIETGWYHLGDSFEGWMNRPNPDGVEWETTFTIPPFSASMATIQFEAASITIADLKVNGVSIGIPTNHYPVDPIGRQIYRKNLITMPAAAFRPGENTIGFQSLFTDEYDDFEFGNVILYLQ